jgi:hypothetical protein
MMRDIAKEQLELFVNDTMLKGKEGLKYSKCKWREVAKKGEPGHNCDIDTLLFESGDLIFKLEDEEGFYDELNRTRHLFKNMASFNGPPRFFSTAKGWEWRSPRIRKMQELGLRDKMGPKSLEW